MNADNEGSDPDSPTPVWALVGAALIGLGAVFSLLVGFLHPLFPIVVLATAVWAGLTFLRLIPGGPRVAGIVLTVVAVVDGIRESTVSVLLVLVGIVALWIGVSKGDPRRAEKKAISASAREDVAHAQRVRQIQEWERAYRDAHDGAEPPAGFTPPIAMAGGPAPGTTNTLAILALVFGFLGGVIAIPLGFIALSQTKKTGQSGRGMAMAGIILAFVWIAVSVALIAVATNSGSGY